jgi:hypothetical protein
MVHSVGPRRRPKASAYWPRPAADTAQAGGTAWVLPTIVTTHPTLTETRLRWARQLRTNGEVTRVSTNEERATRQAILEAAELTRVTDCRQGSGGSGGRRCSAVGAVLRLLATTVVGSCRKDRRWGR